MKNLLDKYYNIFNSMDYFQHDPISIPKKFKTFKDIEISAFITSVLSFGNRKIILRKCQELLYLMDNKPYDFLMFENYEKLNDFKHRTIKSSDIIFLLKSLKILYEKHDKIENLFNNDIKLSIHNFRNIIFNQNHDKYSERHLPDPLKNSACKRINMFLRWMIRKDNVDIGLWKSIDQKNLFIPLDIHVGNVSRKLKLLERKQNDWKSVSYLTEELKNFDQNDPVKYDFALFGIGINKTIL